MRIHILAAPGVGIVWGTAGATETTLSDRVADGAAFPGEHMIRLPRRLTRDYHGLWLVGRSQIGEAARRSIR